MAADKISLDIDHYEPSDSEEEYTPRERALLEKVRKQQQQAADESSEEEVLGLDAEDSEDDSEEDEDDIGQFQDSEDEEDADEGLPDVRAWGKKKHAYYETDFVDQDYAAYSAKEEELAALELQEAKSIQQRLAKQLNESDFSLDLLAPSEPAGDDDEAKLTTDFGKLTVREKKMLFKKDSPEFEGLVADMHHHLEESQAVLLPFLDYCRQHSVTGLPILKFAKTLNNLYLNYGNNVAYYLILKAKRISVKSHPVVKRLVQMRQLIEQLVDRYEKIVKPEIERLLADLKAGKTIELMPLQVETHPKKMARSLSDDELNGDDESNDDDDFLDEQPKAKRMKLDAKPNLGDESDLDEDADEDQDSVTEKDKPEGAEGEDGEVGDEDHVRRPINYQIAKNKGLTARKFKAEQRNPRVRNRKRFMKAVKRRKGSVRMPRTSIPKYDGEATGIKAYLKRSINIK